MLTIIQKAANFLKVPEMGKETLFETYPDLVTHRVSSFYDTIRASEYKGLSRNEIKAKLIQDKCDEYAADNILIEYDTIRKVGNRQKAKCRLLRSVPILLFGASGIFLSYAFRHSLESTSIAQICILSVIISVIAGVETLGGLLQLTTGWS